MNLEKTSVNWYAHGARYFEPQLSRWHSSYQNHEIHWWCDKCDNEGVISEWEGCRWDNGK